jgi:hypothetical protein
MAVHPVDGDHPREPLWIEIRDVLMKHWDPIGVADEPFAADEYDGYIPQVKALMRAHEAVDPLMDYLHEVEVKRMGLKTHREVTRTAAEHLLTLRTKLSPLPQMGAES